MSSRQRIGEWAWCGFRRLSYPHFQCAEKMNECSWKVFSRLYKKNQITKFEIFVQLFHKINSNTLTLYKHFWPWGASSSGLVSQSSLSQAFIWSTIIVWVFIQSTETVLKWIDVKIWMEKKCSRTFLLPFDCAFSVKQIFGDSRIGQDQKNGEHYQTLHIFCKWLSLNFSLDFL